MTETRQDIVHYATRFDPAKERRPSTLSSHLRALEAESIFIMREVAAEMANPVLLYSIGKDSSVMLHLAMKAFWPAKPPFPLMHIATGWDFFGIMCVGGVVLGVPAFFLSYFATRKGVKVYRERKTLRLLHRRKVR